MTLAELSREYRESGEKCKARLAELEPLLSSQSISETERLRLRRRVYILGSMARETIATANYLKKYYGADKNAC